jgi:hypothetical protein
MARAVSHGRFGTSIVTYGTIDSRGSRLKILALVVEYGTRLVVAYGTINATH